VSKRTPKHQEDTTGIYIVPSCPLHGYTGRGSVMPEVMGCASCVEVNALYAVASSDSSQSYVKVQMLQDLVHHWAEGIKSGKFTTVEDLISDFKVEKNGQKLN
jgi:hypothetical protein